MFARALPVEYGKLDRGVKFVILPFPSGKGNQKGEYPVPLS
jgi:hypothetical protein